MNAIDIIARGMAGTANEALKTKADLVDGKVPASQLPSYVDDVVEVDTYDDLPNPGERGKIYVTLDDNKTYRWGGSSYVLVSGDLPAFTADDAQKVLNVNDDGTGVEWSSLRTVNGNSLFGTDDLKVKTYQPFPTGSVSEHQGFKTNGTLQEFIDSVQSYVGGKEGMAFLGEVYGECTPFGYGNAECTVTYMLDGLAVLDVSSSDISPYHWELNTASGVWRKYSDVSVSSTGTATDYVQYITVDGTEKRIGAPITAADVTYTKDTTVTTTVGGLKAGFNLKGHTIENIIERLVGSYTPPSFTSSSLSTNYNTSNTRSGATSYLMGDTAKLDSVTLTLTKGTDFAGLVNGVVKVNNSGVYTLTQDEIDVLSETGTLTKNFDGVTYTFPADQTSGSVTFSVSATYSKKSYDENEQIITTNVVFGTSTKKISAQDTTTYDVLYYGAIPVGKTIASLSPDGTVKYDGGSEVFSHKSSLGSVQITTTDDKNRAAFVVTDELTDIKFMTNSDIENWTKTQETMSYTRDNGTSYSKVYYIYTNDIATGSFTYVLS